MNSFASVKFIIGVGQDKDGNKLSGPDGGPPEHNSDADIAITAILAVVAQRFGGFTKTHGFGGWLNDGILVAEPCVIIEASCTDQGMTDGDIHLAARYIASVARDALNQQCVLVEFVSGKSILV